MSSKLFVRERIEELRSRISLLRSTLRSLKQNYWNIYKELRCSRKTPPYIYPTSAFNRLEETLKECTLDVDPDSGQYAMLLRLNEIHYKCNGILVETNKLQEALNQRISGLGIMKSVEQQPVFQVESGSLSKVYCAIDTVVLELFKIILGNNWVRDNKYVPISLLNSQTGGYTIHLNTLLISAPYHDSFRARFWPALAHEVSHILVYEKMENPGRTRAFTNKLTQGTYELRHLLNQYRETSLQIANIQIHELASDIISCYICPPTYLCAAINLAIPADEPYSPPLYQIYPIHSHPPLDSRISAMDVVLQNSNILSVSEPFQKMVQGVNQFLDRKNLTLSTQSDTSYQFLLEYNEFAKRFSREIGSLLSTLGLTRFKGEDWCECRDSYFVLKERRTPTQLLCADWIKRLNEIKNDSNINLQTYFKKRENEPKIFEQLIHNLYTCYEDIVEKIREDDMFDICVNLD